MEFLLPFFTTTRSCGGAIVYLCVVVIVDETFDAVLAVAIDADEDDEEGCTADEWMTVVGAGVRIGGGRAVSRLMRDSDFDSDLPVGVVVEADCVTCKFLLTLHLCLMRLAVPVVFL